MSNFLKEAIDRLFIYKTPKKIIKYIEKHKYDFLIINPPFKNE